MATSISIAVTFPDGSSTYTHKPVSMTAKAWNWNGSTSNSVLSFTNIPYWATRIIMIFDRVTISTADSLGLRLGDASGFATTGYSGTHNSWSTSHTSTSLSASSFLTLTATSANVAVSGLVTIELVSGSKWSASFVGASTNSAQLHLSAGSKQLPDVLTQVEVQVQSGGNLSGGTVNVIYE